MRALILMVMCSFAFAEEYATTNQDNTSIASPTSTMSNVQVNNGALAQSHFGGGVSCAEPTINFSAARTPNNGEYYATTISTPLTSAFRTSDCDKAARLQNQIKTQAILDARHESARREEYHQAKMEREWLAVAEKQAQLANICMQLHKQISGNPLSEIWTLCNNFAPITKDHHKGHAPINTALIPETHKRISANRQDRE